MLTALSLFAVFISIAAFSMALWAVIEIKSGQKSTHQVQFVPAEKLATAKTEVKDFYAEDFDNIV